MTLLDSLDQVISGIVDTRDDVSITLGVGGPENDDLVEVILFLEVSVKTLVLLDMQSMVVGWKDGHT